MLCLTYTDSIPSHTRHRDPGRDRVVRVTRDTATISLPAVRIEYEVLRGSGIEGTG